MTSTPSFPDRKGKRYESREDEGRIVRVIEQDGVDWRDEPVWAVESIANPRVPGAVGRKTKVGDRTLRRRYRELSH